MLHGTERSMADSLLQVLPLGSRVSVVAIQEHLCIDHGTLVPCVVGTVHTVAVG